MPYDWTALIWCRYGYASAFFDRQLFLEILYTKLGENQDRVHTSKKVVKVEHLPTKVLVHCADQSVIEGDIVVGADGVRSTVRQEMWRHMESIGLEKEVKKEKASMLDLERGFIAHTDNASYDIRVLLRIWNIDCHPRASSWRKPSDIRKGLLVSDYYR